MKRDIGLLAICQAFLMTSQSVAITTSGLIGLMIAPSPQLATVPYALQFVAITSITYFASLLMGRIGRRRGFLFAIVIGCVGAAVATAAIMEGSFLWFCIGSFLCGVFFAFAQYYRFAAAEIVPPDYRSRAISLVIAGGVLAGFFGPWIGMRARFVISDAEFAGGFAAMFALHLLSAVVIACIRFPREAAVADEPARPLSAIVRQPAYIVAMLAAVIAYGSMNIVMTATPLAMQARGFHPDLIALIISCHILGMFGPAFITGHLIRWFGVLNVMLWGALLLTACVVINLAGAGTVHFWTALILLGVGWNFLFTGGTTLLTETYRASEKARAQGFNDLVVYTTLSITAIGSGGFHAWFGWETINLGVTPFLVLAVTLIVWFRFRARPAVAGA